MHINPTRIAMAVLSLACFSAGACPSVAADVLKLDAKVRAYDEEGTHGVYPTGRTLRLNQDFGSFSYLHGQLKLRFVRTEPCKKANIHLHSCGHIYEITNGGEFLRKNAQSLDWFCKAPARWLVINSSDLSRLELSVFDMPDLRDYGPNTLKPGLCLMAHYDQRKNL